MLIWEALLVSCREAVLVLVWLYQKQILQSSGFCNYSGFSSR